MDSKQTKLIKKALTSALLGGAAFLSKKALQEIWNLKKNDILLTYQVDAHSYDNFGVALEMIHKLNNDTIKKNLSSNVWDKHIYKDESYNIEDIMRYRVPRTGKYLIHLNELNFIIIEIVNSPRQDLMKTNGYDVGYAMGEMYINFTFIGKQAKSYYTHLIKSTESVNQISPKYASIYDKPVYSKLMDGEGTFNYSRFYRTPDSIYMNTDQKETIIKFLNDFKNSEDKFRKFKLKHKCGILFYGKAGCGKTSLSYMIADYLGYQHITINLDCVSISKIRKVIKPYMVIYISDIDCNAIDREHIDNLNVNIDERLKKLKDLLMLLDGNHTPSNIVFIADTNDITKLDSALLRDCRFDLTMELEYLQESVAIDMCEHFEVDPNIALDGLELPVRPATLQNKIMNYM